MASTSYNIYGVMGGVPKMLMEMPLAQTIVKSLAMNLSPLVLSFLLPLREQIIDSDLHVCTHVREGKVNSMVHHTLRGRWPVTLLC